MGLFSRRREWTESTLEAPLYPPEAAAREAFLSFPEVRIKHFWVSLSVRPTPSGKYRGKPMVIASIGQQVIGQIRFADSERPGVREVWNLVVRERVNVGTACLAYNGRDGGATATLTLGPHQYQPRR